MTEPAVVELADELLKAREGMDRAAFHRHVRACRRSEHDARMWERRAIANPSDHATVARAAGLAMLALAIRLADDPELLAAARKG